MAHRLYLRLTGHERLEHAALVLSFGALVGTGFMLRYPEAWWVVMIRNFSTGALEWRSLIHRIAGVVMLVAGAWHVWYLVGTARGRELFCDLLPARATWSIPSVSSATILAWLRRSRNRSPPAPGSVRRRSRRPEIRFAGRALARFGWRRWRSSKLRAWSCVLAGERSSPVRT